MLESTLAPDPIPVAISGADRLKWNYAYRLRTQPAWPVFLLMPLLIASSLLSTMHRAHVAPYVRYGLIALLPAMAIAFAIVILLELRRGDTRFTIAFSQKDVELDRNGASEHVAWYAVKGAFSFDRFIAIERRDDRYPILIPLAALSDPSAFWSYLETRLQGSPRSRHLGFPATV